MVGSLPIKKASSMTFAPLDSSLSRLDLDESNLVAEVEA